MDESSHWHECRCGAVSDKSGHDWKVENAKDATATVSGYTGDKICQVCGYTVKGTEIPATGTTTPVKPGDGDSTNSGNGTDADSTKPGNGTDADSTKPGNGTNTDATKPNETMTDATKLGGTTADATKPENGTQSVDVVCCIVYIRWSWCNHIFQKEKICEIRFCSQFIRKRLLRPIWPGSRFLKNVKYVFKCF